ncbi:MAG: hypothetical protein JSV46_07845 [Candidatus Aminicenantes bacterium]|nr:MAG: hypothetical protein JSV46_07845 [Candidatus Aminicenantes bacterium]
MYKNDSDMTILLSKKQVMEEYGLGRHLLDKAMARKEISYIKLERRVLFRREHIEEFLIKNTVKAVSLTEKQLKEYEKRVKKETTKKK